MKVSCLSTALTVEHFDLLIQCVRQVAGFDESTNQFQKGSLALKLGYSLKKCVQIKKTEAVRDRNNDSRQEAEQFETLVTGNWYDLISATAAKSVERKQMNKPKLLPSCEDVEEVQKKVDVDMQSDKYPVLAKAILCAISLLNRKRGGEVHRMKVKDFDRGINRNLSNPDMFKGLSPVEQKLVKYLHHVEIRGKFNRKVPILLTPTMVAGIKTLLRLRSEITPRIDSCYLFARPTGIRPYRGSDVIREYAIEAKIRNSSLFTATNLRKQVATLSQTMEISKWDQDQLATFLGHDIRTHRQIYRQPIEILQKAKVAKILLAVNKGVNMAGVDIDGDVDTNEELPPDDPENGSFLETAGDGNVTAATSTQHIALASPQTNTGETNRSHQTHSPEVTTASCQTHTTEATVLTQNSMKARTVMLGRKRPWSEDEISAVHKHLSQCISLNKVPRKDEAQLAVCSSPALKYRTWKNVKDYVYNLVKKNRAKQSF